VVSRLSQTRRHSWGHSQITKTGSEYEATAARPSGRDEDHFLASIAGKRQERMGEAREGRSQLQAWYMGKLPSLGGFTSSGSYSKFFHSAGRPCSAGFGHHAMIDAFISINAFGPLGARTHTSTSASKLARFQLRS
jgi:hypothetical protein